MAETNPKIEVVTAEAVETTVEETPGRFKTFTLNHPKTAKVVGYTAAAAAILGAVALWKSRKQSDLVDESQEPDDTPFETSSKIA